MRSRTLALTVLAIAAPTCGQACLWDYDTLAMERRQFPQAQELVAGHFLRHSDAYYEWRITDRNGKAVAERSAADLDDLAVAYDKLGDHDKAIIVIVWIVRKSSRKWKSSAVPLCLV